MERSDNVTTIGQDSTSGTEILDMGDC